MNATQLRAASERASRVNSPYAQANHGPKGLSRREFVRTTAGVVAAGAVAGTGLWRPSLAYGAAFASSDPVPIPGGTPGLGGAFHIYAPAAIDSIDAEPITITDFNGFVGLTYLSGTVTRRNRVTREVVELPFLGADMRFMHGIYRGADGRIRQGTFGFV